MSIPKRTETIKRHIEKYEKYLQSEKTQELLRDITILDNDSVN